MSPLITVLMTTYNEEKNIFIQSLNSIINQTFKDFILLIIVDNPNNKEVVEIIKKYASKDNRIKYIINEENIGLPLSLNKGIDLVETKYIARMDADDIADRNRLEIQLEYANRNQDVDLFGSNIIYMNYEGDILYKRNESPEEYKSIKKAIKYVNIFNHPTYFGKTEVFKKFKYRNLKYSQDYDFICRLVENGCKLQNMKDYLLNYRLPQNLSEEKVIIQKTTYYCIQKEYVRRKLSKVDIQERINNELKKVNKENALKAIKIYDTAFEYLRERKRVQAITYLIKSCFLSKYQRRQVLNLVRYFFVRKLSRI
ncbi:MAG: glycosyltransferase [Clostridia bacterium]|nr:glycosyltransferase [Clostridia bacterium]